MRTAVDTTVILDVLTADKRHGERSRLALRQAIDTGAVVACGVVWAEVRGHFGDARAFARAIDALGLVFDPMSETASALAGGLWSQERGRRSKASGRLVVADLMVGAHALIQADQLLARDRGYYRRLFKDLRVIDPSA